MTELYGDEFSVSSKPVVVMDAKTIKIPAFTYDGQGGEVYFFAGEGPQPSSKGFIVPDELGYLAPLGIYRWNSRYVSKKKSLYLTSNLIGTRT